MRRYRLFLVDPAGRVEEERAFEATGDDDAKKIAEHSRGRRRAELWGTHRRIAKWGVGSSPE